LWLRLLDVLAFGYSLSLLSLILFWLELVFSVFLSFGSTTGKGTIAWLVEPAEDEEND